MNESTSNQFYNLQNQADLFSCDSLDFCIQLAKHENKLVLIEVHVDGEDFIAWFESMVLADENLFQIISNNYSIVRLKLSELPTLRQYYYVQLSKSALLIFQIKGNDELSMHSTFQEETDLSEIFMQLQEIPVIVMQQTEDELAKDAIAKEINAKAELARKENKFLLAFVKQNENDFDELKSLLVNENQLFFENNFVVFELKLNHLNILQEFCFISIESSTVLIFKVTAENITVEKQLSGLNDGNLLLCELINVTRDGVSEMNDTDGALIDNGCTLDESIRLAYEMDKLLLIFVDQPNCGLSNDFGNLLKHETSKNCLDDGFVIFRIDFNDLPILKRYYYVTVKTSALLLFQANEDSSLSLKILFEESEFESQLMFQLYQQQVQFSQEVEERYENDLSVCYEKGIGFFKDVCKLDHCAEIKEAIDEIRIQPSYLKKAIVLLFINDRNCTLINEFAKVLKQHFSDYFDLFNIVPWFLKRKIDENAVVHCLKKYAPGLINQIDLNEDFLCLVTVSNRDDEELLIYSKVQYDFQMRPVFEEFISNFIDKFDITALMEMESIEKCRDLFANLQLKTLRTTVEDCVTQSKVLLLYCKGNDNSGLYKDIVKNRTELFSIVAWDTSVQIAALQKIINREFDVQKLQLFVAGGKTVTLVFVPVGKTLIFYSVFDSSAKSNMQRAIQFLLTECRVDHTSQNGPIAFHQMMMKEMGDRDYDAFVMDDDMHKEALFSKVLYSFCGPPASVEGYKDSDKKKAQPVYDIIVQTSTECSENGKTVYVSFMWAALSPFPHEKLKKSQKNAGYVSHEDFQTVPLFVVRKCRNAANPCRFIVDHQARVYSCWENFLDNNKYPDKLMILPRNGKYCSDWKGNVCIEIVPTPASKIGQTVLTVVDYGSTAVGIIGATTAAAGTFFAMPIVVPVGIASATVAGIYGIARSAHSLVDRALHRQSMDIRDAEPRAAYLNIIAGSAGLITAGASALLAAYASTGAEVSQGIRIGMNVLTGGNVISGGVALGNSAVDIYIHWSEEAEINSLTCLQVGFSLLFFANAVYTMQSANTIIEQAQFKSLQETSNSLRSNRHRKTFDRLQEATRNNHGGNVQKANAEVIKFMRNLDNRDDVLAVLTRNTKLISKEGVKFSVGRNQQVLFNGEPINLQDFGAAAKTARIDLLSKLPSAPKTAVATTSARSNAMWNTVTNEIRSIPLETVWLNALKVAMSDRGAQSKCEMLLEVFTNPIKKILLSLANKLIPKVVQETSLMQLMKEVYPQSELYPRLLQLVIRFFQSDEVRIFLENTVPIQYRDQLKNITKKVEKVIIYCSFNITDLINTLVKYVFQTLKKLVVDKIYNQQNENAEAFDRAVNRSLQKCSVCCGEFYS